MPKSSFVKAGRLSVLATALLLAACAPMQVKKVPDSTAAQETKQAAAELPANLPKQELTEQVLYEFLLAEVAGQRGDAPLASEAYLDLAKSTRDPRLAQRATEVSLFARRYDAALEAAKLWLELEPDSLKAQQTVVAIMLNNGKLAEVRPLLEKLIAADTANRAKGFLQLNGLFSKQTDRKAVLKLVEDLAKPYPALPEAHYAVAYAAWGAQQRDRALEEIRTARQLRPEWEGAVLFEGEILRHGSPAEAKTFYQSYLQDHPKAREVRLAYARLLVGEKDYAEARNQFRRLMADFPGSPEVSLAVGLLSLQLGDLDGAEEQLQQALAHNYGDADTVYLYLGQVSEARNRPDEALERYGKVGEGESYVAAQIRIANLLAKQGKLEEGLDRFHQVKPADLQQQAQLALAEAQLLRDYKRYQQAFDVLDKALKKQPKHTDLLYDQALAAEKIGRLDVLEKNLRKAIQLKPDFAQAYNALGYTFADRNERLDEAQKLLEKANQLSPDDPFILDSLGWLSYRRHNLAKAEGYLRQALAAKPDPEIAAHLGEVLWARGHKDEAKKVWAEALKNNPDNEALLAAVKKFQSPQ
ncbi:MAG: tetratricopeptide repeat protein [Sulfuricellaceae bacterium]